MASCVQVFPTESDVCTELCRLIEKKAQETLSKAKHFRIGLSGGSLVKLLCQGLPKIHSEWNRWQLFFCDERLLPFDDPESSFGVYRRELIGKVPLSENQFVLIDPSLPVEAAAEDYEGKLRQSFGDVSLPRFDLLLLGMGPDGHTCSLFPGHKALQVQSTWVTSINDSPKPPPCRVTLTLPVVNNAECCVFPITGESKASMIHKILDDKEQFPAGMIKPTNGIIYWLLDKNAASQLAKKKD